MSHYYINNNFYKVQKINTNFNEIIINEFMSQLINTKINHSFFNFNILKLLIW